MYDKLQAAENRYEEINHKLSDPQVIANQDEYRALMKEHSELDEIVQKYREYKNVNKEIDDAKGMLEDKLDKDFRDMVEEELKEALDANLGRARRYDEAIEQLNRTLTIDPNFYATRYALGTVLHAKGQYSEAVAEYRKALALSDDPWAKALLARSLARSGQRDEARKLLGELQSESARRYVPSSGLAVVFAALGEKDKAFASLEKDVEERSPRPPLYAVNPVFDDLRDDPRFPGLLRRIEASKID
jgi:Flp pilus assembly protein TadD